MLRVGLTGSIGVGKSYVSGIFGELGCHIVDADQLARAVVEKGSTGLQAVVEVFGREMLKADGSLHRQRLAALIFSDKQKRELLNSVLHPYIIAEQDHQMDEWERKDPFGITVVDAALMVESGGYKRFDKLIVVHCDPQLQLERVMERNALSREETLKRINSQMSQAEKKKFADYLVDTTFGFDSTRKQTIEIHQQLLLLSRGASKDEVTNGNAQKRD